LAHELRGIHDALEDVEFHIRKPDLEMTNTTARAILRDAIAALASPAPMPECDLCVGKCRGHSLGHPEQWEPEPGSRAALGSVQDKEIGK
jgi:hypothetical protein